MDKEMTAREFKESGLLQEVNRRFLHPMGVCLSVVEVEGEMELGPIFDYRDDPLGIIFDESLISQDKALAVYDMERPHREARFNEYGFVVQPYR